MMKEFDVSFTAIERTSYVAVVEAETPEEAIKLFKDDCGEHDWEEEMYESTDEILNVKCIGERITDEDGGSHLESFDKPIKLEE